MNDAAETWRHLSRLCTRMAGGIARQGHAAGPAMAEARLLLELGHPDPGAAAPAAADLARALAMDTAQVSRLLRGLAAEGLIERRPAAGRRLALQLAPRGRAALATLEETCRADMARLLEPLAPPLRAELAACLRRASAILAAPVPAVPVLRPARPGEYGWIVTRHATLYGAEQGWDALAFEAYVAGLLAKFGAARDPARQSLWIAAIADAPVGSVAVVDAGGGTARLRLLILDPAVRGRGVGRALLAEAMHFARSRGYERMTLSTYASLTAARSLYAAHGFVLTHAAPVREWGHDLVTENWDRIL